MKVKPFSLVCSTENTPTENTPPEHPRPPVNPGFSGIESRTATIAEVPFSELQQNYSIRIIAKEPVIRSFNITENSRIEFLNLIGNRTILIGNRTILVNAEIVPVKSLQNLNTWAQFISTHSFIYLIDMPEENMREALRQPPLANASDATLPHDDHPIASIDDVPKIYPDESYTNVVTVNIKQIGGNYLPVDARTPQELYDLAATNFNIPRSHVSIPWVTAGKPQPIQLLYMPPEEFSRLSSQAAVTIIRSPTPLWDDS